MPGLSRARLYPAGAGGAGREAVEQADWGDLPDWQRDRLTAALPALGQSCSVLARKPFGNHSAWSFQGWKYRVRGHLAAIFRSHAQALAAGQPGRQSKGLVTGYYEPVIRGSRYRSEANRWPIYGVPEDMLTIDQRGLPGIGQIVCAGASKAAAWSPYRSRGEINEGQRLQGARAAVGGRSDRPFFFRSRARGGCCSRMARWSVGYADQNGFPYQSIGRWLVAQGELTLDKASMAGIKSWARANPRASPNCSRATPASCSSANSPGTGGPIGALGVPLSAERSIAVDPHVVPLGAPVYLATSWPNESCRYAAWWWRRIPAVRSRGGEGRFLLGISVPRRGAGRAHAAVG